MGSEEKRPLVIYDGDCDYCGLWISRWRKRLRDKLDFAPFQEVWEQYPYIPRDNFSGAVHLIMPDGTAYSGAEAVFSISKAVGQPSLVWWLYRHFPGIAPITERGYKFVASHRDLCYKTTAFLWGPNLGPHEYSLTRWLFLRVIGIIYFIAFASLAGQVMGLIGSGGILPVSEYLDAIAARFDSPERFALLPTLLWADHSDAFIQVLCIGGMLLSVLVVLDIATMPVLAVLWAGYLSLVNGGQDFLSFQWDILLLETGFLAIFLSSFHIFPRIERQRAPSMVIVWLFRFLLFRLMFMSGIIKFASGDPTWSNLTALDYHYWTQPLPTPLAWFAAQMPQWFHQISALIMFFIELVVPFMFFMPRRIRFIGAWLTILLQVMIILTGNYTFFNWLTIALCILLFDDDALRRWFPARLRDVTQARASRIKRVVAVVLAALLIFLGSLQVLRLLDSRINPRDMPAPVADIFRRSSALHLSSGYGLFATMTTTRPEIIVEGSDDGEEWLPYTFRFKVGDIYRPPPIVAPHQPRLDWQMWFAALGSYENNPWFISFIRHLLLGSRDVLDLLEANPFPARPPEFIRARLFHYRFTSSEERAANGAWWVREEAGLYLPPVSLDDFTSRP
jgi:predicted DCC family thiol-disulfide oxidoreductase YuxK